MSDRQTERLGLMETAGDRLCALSARLTLPEDVAERLLQELFPKLHGARGQGGIEVNDPRLARTVPGISRGTPADHVNRSARPVVLTTGSRGCP